MKRHPRTGLLLAAFALTCVQSAPRVELGPQDLAPEDGILSGCDKVRGDADLTVVHCPASLSRDGKGSIYYLFRAAVVPDRTDRLLYNKLLNGMIGSNLSICVACDRETYRRSLEGLMKSVNVQQKKRFLEAIFLARDSTAWADGNATGAHHILSSDFAQPEGGGLLNRALSDAARSCDLAKLDEVVVSEFILLDYRGGERTLMMIGQCPCNENSVGLLLVTAIGLAHVRQQEAGVALVGRVAAYAKERGLNSLSETAATIKEALPSLPNEPSKLRTLIAEWLQVPI